MKPNRLSDFPNGVFSGLAGGDATGKVQNVPGVVCLRSLDNDGLTQPYLRPFIQACFMTLAHVLFDTLSPDLPTMVTVPRLSGCRDWR